MTDRPIYARDKEEERLLEEGARNRAAGAGGAIAGGLALLTLPILGFVAGGATLRGYDGWGGPFGALFGGVVGLALAGIGGLLWIVKRRR